MKSAVDAKELTDEACVKHRHTDIQTRNRTRYASNLILTRSRSRDNDKNFIPYLSCIYVQNFISDPFRSIPTIDYLSLLPFAITINLVANAMKKRSGNR